MTPAATLPSPTRLTALDVFRGITLAGMILVNNPGTWGHVYGPLRHAAWNGWTPTDLVFPSFVFIVGTAIAFAFRNRRARGETRGLLLLHAGRRAIVLFTLGLLLTGVKIDYINGRGQDGVSHWQVIVPYVLVILAAGFLWPAESRIARDGWRRHTPRAVLAGLVLLAGIFTFLYYWAPFQESNLRVPGVLQRIALCYLIASIIVLYFGVRGRIFWTAVCLASYWALLRYISPTADFDPALEGPGARLHEWIDIHVLGGHLYSHRPDPEGLLSTLPAVATALLGVLAGDWLCSPRSPEKKAAGLLLAGIIGLFVGLILNHWIPINKKIWTSSYVLFTGGFALHMLACCYVVVDLAGWRRWAAPFMVLGTNTITIYVLSSLTGWLLAVDWSLPRGGVLNVKKWLCPWIVDHVQGVSPEGASLIFAIGFVLLWILLFVPLYRGRVFIRV